MWDSKSLVKAGGMRITQHKIPKDERDNKAHKDQEESKISARYIEYNPK